MAAPCGIGHAVVSIFFSSPNLSGRRLDVYHTSTHGVVLVRIKNAGLKRAARGSLKYRTQKNRHLGTIAQLCRATSSQLRHVSTIRKKLVKEQHLLHMSSQYGELRHTSGVAEIDWRVWGTPANFNGFRSCLGSVTARHSGSERQPNFAALNRRRNLYSAGRPSHWASTHILVCFILSTLS